MRMRSAGEHIMAEHRMGRNYLVVREEFVGCWFGI
jgi:hypothetical protein